MSESEWFINWKPVVRLGLRSKLMIRMTSDSSLNGLLVKRQNDNLSPGGGGGCD